MSSKLLLLVVLLTAVHMLTSAYAKSSTFWINTTSETDSDINVNNINFFMPSPIDILRVYALPVGQGDCTIIQCPGTVNDFEGGELVVVDCGSIRGARLSAQDIQGFLSSQTKRRINIFITHADKDHLNYLPIIFNDNTFDIRTVVLGGRETDYKRTAINNWKQGEWRFINDQRPCIGNCKYNMRFCKLQPNIQFDILAANNGNENDKNSDSIVMKVSIPYIKQENNYNTILLPGDMEGPVANRIAAVLGPALKSTVYKIAHHGASSKANSYEWLSAIQPKMAFASSAHPSLNQYGHPRCDTIFRLTSLGTIEQADEPHMFSCGTGRNTPFDQVFNVKIYETSPSAKDICLITYQFIDNADHDVDMNLHCMTVPQEEVDSEDYCCDAYGDCENEYCTVVDSK